MAQDNERTAAAVRLFAFIQGSFQQDKVEKQKEEK